MRIYRLLFLLIATFFYATAWAQSLEDAEDTYARIATAAERTVARRQSETVLWKTVVELGPGNRFAEIVYAVAPQRRRMTVRLTGNGKTTQIADIVERDDRWYVVNFDQSYQCRPYEAQLLLPVAYRLLAKADLNAVVDPDVFRALNAEVTVDASEASLNWPLSAEAGSQVRQLIRGVEEAFRTEDSQQDREAEVIRARAAGQLDALKDVLANGMTWRVNLEHGYLSESGLPGQRVVVKQFDFVSEAKPEVFDIGQEPWDEHTPPGMTGAAGDDVAMICHSRIWDPKGPTPDLDVKLLNTTTGETRRVPFTGGLSSPGCFSRDRLKAYVTGTTGALDAWVIFEVDLQTGTNRALGLGEFRGAPLAPVLSPDGTTLAVTDFVSNRGEDPQDDLLTMFKSQVRLIDVSTEAVRAIGAPLDAISLNWLPNNSGLILVVRKSRDPNKPSDETISRMDLDGNVVALRRGSSAQLVRGGTRILYEEPATEQWFTCDLAGSDPVLVGDGLKEFGFPAASPSGDKVLMMRFAEPTGPRPYVVDVVTGAASPIPVGEGLWAFPRWR